MKILAIVEDENAIVIGAQTDAGEIALREDEQFPRDDSKSKPAKEWEATVAEAKADYAAEAAEAAKVEPAQP